MRISFISKALSLQVSDHDRFALHLIYFFRDVASCPCSHRGWRVTRRQLPGLIEALFGACKKGPISRPERPPARDVNIALPALDETTEPTEFQFFF